ncbi:MAG: hypothetical protein QF824_04635 [Candidatus Woesearchaeota archaeon]|jgi:hypothetical protein|nr:hypothetical protein [Candidatus Woesearchaeota archaeon]
MKKRNIGVLLVVLAFLLSAVSVTAVNLPAEWAKIEVTLVNQEPDPVEPGSFVDVRFKFENRGSDNAEDVVVELLPETPFSIYTGSAIEKIGSVHGRQIGDIGRIVKYRLRVDKDAVEGENKLKLRYKINNGEWIELSPFLIDVRTPDAILSVESETVGGSIKSGQPSTFIVKVHNMADSLLKTLKFKLDLSGIPVTTIDSTNEKTLIQLAAGKEGEVEFNLIAEPNAVSSIYKVPLRIDYSDKLGNNFQRNNTVGLIVGDVPDLSVVLDSSTIYTAGKVGEIGIKFTNKGVTDLKFLNIKLKETDAFRLITVGEIYVGNIDSDDYETAEFKMFVSPTKKKEITLPLSIEYKDANNNDFKEDINLKLKVYSSSEAKKFGLIKGSNFTGIFIVLLIVGGGLWFYRRWRKRRHKK